MIKIMDTTLRDGQQSLIATRMSTEQMLPVVADMDNAGFYAMEMWGGATFDSCIRFLNEDPWERLRKIRAIVKNTKLQMLLRGQNLLGYRCYADDTVSYFIQKAIANGIDVIRMFDALNDIRNLEIAVKAIKKEGGLAQLAISYTTSEVHTIEYYVALAKQFQNIGADSIAVKDMSGLLLPYTAYELVKEIKKTTGLPVQVHAHCTSGVADLMYMKAIEAGADIIDTAISPLSMGTSQPPTEVMVETLRGTEYDTGIKEEALKKISSFFLPIRNQAIESGLLDYKVLSVDTDALVYQVPGGMLSNLISQLKQQKAENKFTEVLEEIPRVRADLGYPPLVTPTSQIVGTQAVFNVLMGERYKMVVKETKDIVRGMYGKTPVPISDDIRKKIIGDEKPITDRPGSLIADELPKVRQQIKNYITQDEDVLTYALFPKVAEDFFKLRQARASGIDTNILDADNKIYPV